LKIVCHKTAFSKLLYMYGGLINKKDFIAKTTPVLAGITPDMNT